MRSGLTKPRMLSVKQMASRLLVLSSYLSKFPEPGNKVFTTGDMIEMFLCMIPKDWTTCMAKGGIEARNMTYQALIDHLVTLEATDATSSSNKGGSSGGNSKNTKCKGDKPGKGKPSYTNKNGNPKEGGSKECGICKLFEPKSNA